MAKYLFKSIAAHPVHRVILYLGGYTQVLLMLVMHSKASSLWADLKEVCAIRVIVSHCKYRSEHVRIIQPSWVKLLDVYRHLLQTVHALVAPKPFASTLPRMGKCWT